MVGKILDPYRHHLPSQLVHRNTMKRRRHRDRHYTDRDYWHHYHLRRRCTMSLVMNGTKRRTMRSDEGSNGEFDLRKLMTAETGHIQHKSITTSQDISIHVGSNCFIVFLQLNAILPFSSLEASHGDFSKYEGDTFIIFA
jgi:hypothetical protein